MLLLCIPPCSSVNELLPSAHISSCWFVLTLHLVYAADCLPDLVCVFNASSQSHQECTYGGRDDPDYKACIEVTVGYNLCLGGIAVGGNCSSTGADCWLVASVSNVFSC